MKYLAIVLALASCTPAAAVPEIPQPPRQCAPFPREAVLHLPADAASILAWHNEQRKVDRAAYLACARSKS